MKYITIIIFSFLVSACNTIETEISEPSAEESKSIKVIGDTMSTKLLTALKNELTQAIQEKGVENAIQVCNLKALPITNKIANSFEYHVDIKRVTNKYRNPQNKPNQVEKLALDHYMQYQKNKKPQPEYYIQKVTENNIAYLNYYKPINTGAMCLMCHGDPKTMSKSLINVIDRLYPNDLAQGYKEGDFRGLLRISIKTKK